VGQDRYRLKEKMTYAGIMDGEKFWDTFSLRLAKRYDLAQIGLPAADRPDHSGRGRG
jgi:hypothetical protein